MPDSSELLAVLVAFLQFNNIIVALLTAIGYDYVLTFSNEIEYIWSKPWTSVSTMFILVRYVGLCNFVISYLGQTSFLLNPAQVFLLLMLLTNEGTESESRRETLAIVNEWLFVLFLLAADAVMVLRVWAMYNRSRLILGILLAFFSMETISNILAAGVNSDPKKLVAFTFQILDFSFCQREVTEPVWMRVSAILQITQSAVTFLLVVFHVTRESFEMYRLTKQWKLNRYLVLLFKQGILTFFAFFLFDLLDVLLTSTTSGGLLIPLVILEALPLYILTPRFILSIRELYARDAGGELEAIDTGFGLSRSGVTTMSFADPGQHEGAEDVLPIDGHGTSSALPV